MRLNLIRWTTFGNDCTWALNVMLTGAVAHCSVGCTVFHDTLITNISMQNAQCVFLGITLYMSKHRHVSYTHTTIVGISVGMNCYPSSTQTSVADCDTCSQLNVLTIRSTVTGTLNRGCQLTDWITNCAVVRFMSTNCRITKVQ